MWSDVTENKCLHTVASCWTFINIYLLTYLLTYLHTHSHTYLHTYLKSRVLVEKPRVPQLVRNFPHTMEPDGSLPCSKQPNICPYPEPDKASLCCTPCCAVHQMYGHCGTVSDMYSGCMLFESCLQTGFFT